MAITSPAGILAGARQRNSFTKVGGTMEAAGVMYSMAYLAGVPGAAAVPSPGIGGAALTTYAGQIPWENPASGNSYISLWQGAGTDRGNLIVYDRLWHNSGINVTTVTAQTVNSAQWPARDRNGSVNGADILIGIEVSTATTNGSAVTNTVMSYTDQDGNAGATATIPSFPATAVAGTFVPFLLAAGDNGVRSIQTVTLGTSYGGGAIHLVAYRVLAMGNVLTANLGFSQDALTSGFVRLYDNTVPFLLWWPTATTGVTVQGGFAVAHG